MLYFSEKILYLLILILGVKNVEVNYLKIEFFSMKFLSKFTCIKLILFIGYISLGEMEAFEKMSFIKSIHVSN